MKKFTVLLIFLILPIILFAKDTRKNDKIQNDPPATPNLISPADGATRIPITVNLAWTEVADADSYSLQIADIPNFSNIIFNQNGISSSSFQLSDQIIQNSEKYYWRVKAIDDGLESDWSQEWDFTTEKILQKPVLTYPITNDVISNLKPTFTWNKVDNADNYVFEVLIEIDPDFSIVLENNTPSSNSYTVAGDLVENENLKWRVKGKANSGEESPWSDFTYFRIDLLEKPTLISPINNTEIIATNVTFEWNGQAPAEEYELEIDNNANFSSPIIQETITSQTTYNYQDIFDFGANLFWRIKAINGPDESQWSDNGEFVVKDAEQIPANWSFTDTGISSTVVIPLNIMPMLNNRNFISGDAIGLFYDDNGVMECGGYGVWSSGNNLTVTVYGDDLLTPDKDGFSNGETYTYKAWDAILGEEYEAEATYTSGVDNYSTGNISELATFIATGIQELDINLSFGWNTISSNLIPIDTDLDVIFANIVDDILLLKNGDGQIYAPGFGIDDVGNWNVLEGYQVYATAATTLTITGNKVELTANQISLDIGWNNIAYLPQNSQPIADALSSIDGNFLLAKFNGLIYAPNFNINDIGTMQPKNGYQIYMTTADNLIYSEPALGKHLAIENINPRPQIMKIEEISDNTSIVILENLEYEDGTEIGVWNSNDELIGSNTINNGNAVIVINGKSQNINSNFAKEGEKLQIKVLANGNKYLENIDIAGAKCIQSDKVYAEFVYMQNSILIAEKSNIENAIAGESEIFAYPNPASEFAHIIAPPSIDLHNAEIFIYDISGNSLSNFEYEIQNNSMKFNVSNIANGVYSVTCIYKDNSYRTSFVVE